MRALFWLIGLFSLAVGLSLAARYNDGYALFVLPPWRVEISLNLLAVLLIAGFVFIYSLLRLVANTSAMPGKVRAFRQRKADDKARLELRKAVTHLFEGRYGQAIKNAEAAQMAGEAPGLACVVAARAAHAMNDQPRFQTWIDKASAYDAEIRSARLMSLADLHCRSHRFDEALESLEALDKGGQRHIAALRLLLKARQGAGQWQEVQRLSRHLEKHKAISSEYATALKVKATRQLIQDMDGDPRGLARYFSQLPSSERHNPRLAGLAAQALIQAGDEDAAQAARTIIEAALERTWEPELLPLYAQIEHDDWLSRTAQAEQWLQDHPKDAHLLLALGQLCLQQKLWGKAESYLEAALSLNPSRAPHLALARLHDQFGRTESANRHFRKAAEYA